MGCTLSSMNYLLLSFLNFHFNQSFKYQRFNGHAGIPLLTICIYLQLPTRWPLSLWSNLVKLFTYLSLHRPQDNNFFLALITLPNTAERKWEERKTWWGLPASGMMQQFKMAEVKVGRRGNNSLIHPSIHDGYIQLSQKVPTVAILTLSFGVFRL